MFVKIIVPCKYYLHGKIIKHVQAYLILKHANILYECTVCLSVHVCCVSMFSMLRTVCACVSLKTDPSSQFKRK